MSGHLSHKIVIGFTREFVTTMMIFSPPPSTRPPQPKGTSMHSLLLFMSFALIISLEALPICRKRSFCRAMALRMSSSSSKTLSPGSHISEMEVKKSRFIGYASHVTSWDEASQYIDSVKKEHPKARHWCYGYRGGSNPVTERSNDDGEPSGTAGAPILNAIGGEELSDVVCVVVRYFGGIKLGAGGLIRAYGGAARQVLREAPVDILIPSSQLRVKVDASHVGAVYEAAAKVDGTTFDEVFGEDGSLEVTISCKEDEEERIRRQLQDSTRGDVQFVE